MLLPQSKSSQFIQIWGPLHPIQTPIATFGVDRPEHAPEDGFSWDRIGSIRSSTSSVRSPERLVAYCSLQLGFSTARFERLREFRWRYPQPIAAPGAARWTDRQKSTLSHR
jgi:hypothetical protein